ncbi:MAG: MATE family efflux transporter [Bacillota bacterium]
MESVKKNINEQAEDLIAEPELPEPEFVEEHAIVRQKIWRLAWPVIAEQSLGTVTQIVDQAMVGRLGAANIAAIGLSFQPLFLAMGVFMGIGVGTTALVARFIGAKQPEGASRATANSLTISTILALALSIFAFTKAEALTAFMGASPEVVALGASYIRYLIPGLVFMLAGMVLSGALRGAGDTMTPMKINLVLNVVNVVLNYGLIYGRLGLPEMGLNGAALATSIARGLGGIALLVVVFGGKKAIRVTPRELLKLDLSRISRIVRIGIPAGLERFFMSLGQMFYVKIVASLGTVVYAAHALAINAESISYMPAFGFAAAATTMVGQNLGAGRPRAAKRYGWETWRFGAIVMGSMSIIFLFFPGLLMRIYTNDPDIIRYGSLALRIIAFAQIPMSAGFIVAGALRGAGDTMSVWLWSMVSVWGIRLVLAYLLVVYLGWGLLGAWLAMSADWIFRGTIYVIRWNSGKWAKVKV